MCFCGLWLKNFPLYSLYQDVHIMCIIIIYVNKSLVYLFTFTFNKWIGIFAIKITLTSDNSNSSQVNISFVC